MPLEEVLAHVKISGIDGIEMDYDMLSSNDDEQSILTFLKKAGVHCHRVPESMPLNGSWNRCRGFVGH